MLHGFVRANPAYAGWQDAILGGIPCRVYAADIGRYWLDSTKHDASCQSFYPTWILSAFALSARLGAMGFSELVDIGSGDGRIAYCAGLLGMRACGLEIDGGLVEVQRGIAGATGVKFDAVCADALSFDYSSLGLERPAFVVSGLPEMGGEMLADGVMDALSLDSGLRGRACLVLMGKTGRGGAHGWEGVVEGRGLIRCGTIRLPTYWTAEQEESTPHILVRLSA